jgi:MFS superfamily sulfate permease-like transporter
VAGLSLAAFVIPESLAYASLAPLPLVTGLYCYLVAGVAYALFGTSRQLAVGPTSSLAIVIATSIAAIGGGDPSRVMALASAMALIVAIVSIAGRFIGLANAAYFISDSILFGFKTGAAFYIASTQLPKLFGIEGVSGNFFERVGHVLWSLPETHVVNRDRCPNAGDTPGALVVRSAGAWLYFNAEHIRRRILDLLDVALRASRQSSSTFRWCPQSTPPREAHCARWHARSGPAASQSSLPNCAMRSWTT